MELYEYKTLKEKLCEEDSALSSLLHSFAMHSLQMQDQFPKYLSGVENEPNKYGEAVAKLDRWANDTLVKHLLDTGFVRKIYSEELREPVLGGEDAPFVITMDPLDGSSNITTNNAFGIILGVYRKDLPAKGRELVAACYKLYGPVNTFVYSTGKGVHEFVKHYDVEDNACFYLMHEDIKLPTTPQVFGIGGHPMNWSRKFRDFAKDLFKVHKMKPRYCGTFVADFSQLLHKGGFFSYPKMDEAPGGKLRLYYECQQLAFICEQAGGASWDGKRGSILDVEQKDIDARTPLYLGNKRLIEKLKTL